MQRRLFASCAARTLTARVVAPSATAAVAAASALSVGFQQHQLCAARRFNSTPADGNNKPADDNDLFVEPTEVKGFTEKAGSDASRGEEGEQAVAGSEEEMGFRTETRQLLDIVACSLYSDKEIFVRELISNASDALEKRRHLEAVEPDSWGTEEGDEERGVHISVNQNKTRFVIRDTGVGMTREELMNNLGTIAGSGSKAFVRQIQQAQVEGKAISSADKIIGQFGVGFYSAFMVANRVKVYSRSAKRGSKGYLWESDGHGKFKISECEGVAKGTKIVLEVKDTELSFCTPQVVERIIKKYSNFVEFAISLNGGKVNTVQALWMKGKDEVSNEEHIDFYKFISGAYDAPLSRLHYAVDAPLAIRALLYIPQTHSEKFGGGRMECGVSLYCRRVLIQPKAKDLLPEWLRFIKGAVDCESLPLNISREHTQDGGTMRKLSSVLTKRILRWLDEEARRDRAKFERFIKEFGNFLKEGVCTDQVHKMEIAKLLRFESTAADTSFPLISLDEYRDRMKANQTNIYYLVAPSKDMALASPYYEQYKDHGLEVLVLTEPIDEFVMNHLETYAKYKLQSIETYDASHDGWVVHEKKMKEEEKARGEADKKDGDSSKGDDDVKLVRELSEDQIRQFSDFITKRLLGKVGVVKATTRLRGSPAVVTDHESAQLRRLYKVTGQAQGPPPKYNFQFNPQHDLVRKTFALSTSTDAESVETAGLIVEQLFDNAIIAAGLLDDPRSIVGRLNTILTRMTKEVKDPVSPGKHIDK
jgi:TNF receptor-associated protein 1